VEKHHHLFLISKFRRVLYVVCPASEFYMPTFRNTPSVPSTYLPMKMGQSVPKRRHIKLRRRGTTQKKTYIIIIYQHAVRPPVDPFRSHTSRSLFNGLSWFFCLLVCSFCPPITLGNAMRQSVHILQPDSTVFLYIVQTGVIFSSSAISVFDL